MPKQGNVVPHPAFDRSIRLLLPSPSKATVPLAETTGGFPVAKAQKAHYDPQYLNDLKPYGHDINAFHDWIGFFAMFVVRFGSWAVAWLNPLWIFDSDRLNWFSFMDNIEETVFLRRAILLTGLAWTHTLASVTAFHLRGILNNTGEFQMVQSMLAEFESHSVHYQSFVQVLKPSIFTRVLIIGLCLLVLPLQILAGLVYPSALHAVASFVCSFGTRFYTDAIKAIGRNEMPWVAGMDAPDAAKDFYSLPLGSRFIDFLLCARADDCFHTTFNELCSETNCTRPVSKLRPFLKGSGEEETATGFGAPAGGAMGGPASNQ